MVARRSGWIKLATTADSHGTDGCGRRRAATERVILLSETALILDESDPGRLGRHGFLLLKTATCQIAVIGQEGGFLGC